MEEQRVRRSGVAGLLALVLTLGCGSGTSEEQDLPDDRLWESEHFRYHTRQGDEACEAVLESLERHFELMRGYLGFSWPEGRKVDYYKFRDDADFHRSSGCPADAAACARGPSVLSPETVHEHELIHAYLAPLGLPPAFFAEGAASVLACSTAGEVAAVRPWRDVVGLPYADDDRAYYEGPWFAGYLLHQYGPGPFLEFYGNLSYQAASTAEIAATFESSYGETLDAVWDAALAGGSRVRCVDLWPCSGPALPLDGTLRTLSQACDGTDPTRTFELDAEADAVLGSSGYYVHAPLRCDEELPYYAGGDAEIDGVVYFPALVHLVPGKYFIRPLANRANEVSIRVLDASASGPDCSALEPVDLDSPEFALGHLEVSIPSDGGAWFVKLRPAADRSPWWGSKADPSIEVCDGCDASSCRPLEGNATSDAEGLVTLRLTPPSPRPGATTYLLGY